MQQALAVITPHEEISNIKSELSDQKQDESGTVPTAEQVQTSKAPQLEASLSIPQHQGFAPKHEELGLAETDESISVNQIKPYTDSKCVLECAQKIPNQQGIDHLESTEESLQDEVEEVSLQSQQLGEPAISIKSPKSTGFVPELLSTDQVPTAEEKPEQPNISSKTHTVRSKNLPEQISQPLGQHTKIEYSRALGGSITPPKFADEKSSDNFGDQVVDRISNVVGHGEGHGTAHNIFTTKSSLITVTEKNVSPPAEAHNVDNSEGFLPIQEDIGVIIETESAVQKAVPLTTNLPDRAIQTVNIQGHTQTTYEAHESDKTDKCAQPLSESAKLAIPKSLAHQFATYVDKTTGHGEGHRLIGKLGTEADIHTASEKSVSPPGEAANIGKHEGYVPIEEKVSFMILSDTPSAKAKPQSPDMLNRVIKKESQEGYFGVSDNLGEISSNILPSMASASVTSPTKDIGLALEAGFLPVQEKVDDQIESQTLECKDAQMIEEKPVCPMVAASQSLTGGIATVQEKVEDQANIVAGHLHLTPAITSITDANIAVGQDILLGSHAQKEQQTKEYFTNDAGKAEQIIPTHIANESAICAGQEEVTK